MNSRFCLILARYLILNSSLYFIRSQNLRRATAKNRRVNNPTVHSEDRTGACDYHIVWLPM